MDPQARGKSRDIPFMDRVFTPDERRLIRGSSDPDMMLWSMWAGKETGYKAIRRRYPAVSSAPGRYEVQLPCTGDHVPESGTVHTPCGPISIRFFITGDYVHCIGATADEEVDAIVWDVRKITWTHSSPNVESGFVREMARRSISVYLGEQPEAVDIIRPNEDRGLAPPVVRIGRKPPAINLSMSHDGRFAACAFSVYHAQSGTR
ncbi:MAG: 4-phosphopantetheinyl transferase family protein [Syntrophobacterales bacterium]|nr:MAG: 4-phosphopantetheinyl transferase family protein [Syntrophobacterales bacterium]